MGDAKEWVPTILVVDDQTTNVELLERLLCRAGYERVVGTSAPSEVESFFVTFRPDLVLLDLHMPEIDGFELMKRLSDRMDDHEYVPILVLSADLTTETKQRALTSGAKDFLTKPFDKFEVLARVANLLETRTLHLQLKAHSQTLEDRVQQRTAQLWEAIRDLEAADRELRSSQEEMITRLSRAAEFRDEEASGHIERMSRYCSLVAEQIGESGDRCEVIRIASQMHDIGKIGVPDAVLRKRGQLSPVEIEAMRSHTEIGFRILEGSTSELARAAATIAWTHHEKMDGTGYPRGLSGNGIPLEGRIAAVADAFDAITSHRSYRKRLSLPDAIATLRDGRGSHFDPMLVNGFLDAIDRVVAIKEEFSG